MPILIVLSILKAENELLQTKHLFFIIFGVFKVETFYNK